MSVRPRLLHLNSAPSIRQIHLRTIPSLTKSWSTSRPSPPHRFLTGIREILGYPIILSSRIPGLAVTPLSRTLIQNGDIQTSERPTGTSMEEWGSWIPLVEGPFPAEEFQVNSLNFPYQVSIPLKYKFLTSITLNSLYKVNYLKHFHLKISLKVLFKCRKNFFFSVAIFPYQISIPLKYKFLTSNIELIIES